MPNHKSELKALLKIPRGGWEIPSKLKKTLLSMLKTREVSVAGLINYSTTKDFIISYTGLHIPFRLAIFYLPGAKNHV